MMCYQQWLAQAITYLKKSKSAHRDAEILLSHVTGKSRSFILAFNETLLSAEQLDTLSSLLTRRAHGEPIAYLVGTREFWSLPLFVSPATLIPRPDTECLVEQALMRLLDDKPYRILDLGTGTGAIALALARERPNCQFTAVDIVADAVTLTSRNIAHLGFSNIQVLQSSWFSALDGRRFDMIVSNPPYIDEQDPHLAQAEVCFEPKIALVSASNGLADLAHIIAKGHHYLNTNGWILFEHGWQQGEAVRKLFANAGYCEVETYQDYGGNERLTLGRWYAGLAAD